MIPLNSIKFWIYCSIIIFTTLAYGTVHQTTLILFYISVILLTLVWAASCLQSGVVLLSRSNLQIPLVLLTVYSFVQIIPFGIGSGSGTISVDRFLTQLTAFHLVFISVFFAITLPMIDSAKTLRRTVSVLIVFGFAYSFYAILQSVLSPDKIYGIYQPRSGRPYGSFVNRHNYGAIVEMIVCLPLGLLFAGAVKAEKRLLYVVTIGLMLTSLLLSGSRGGLVAFLAALIFLVILSSRARGTRQVLIRSGLSLLLVLIAVGGAIFVGGDTSLTRFGDAGTENVSSNRTQIWAATLEVIREHFPLGAGLGAFGQAYTPFDDSSGWLRVDQAHNDYLQVLADAGLIGAVLGAAFLFWLFREGQKNISSADAYRRGVALGAAAGIFAVLVHSLFDFVLHITAVSITFLTMITLLVAAGREFGDSATRARRRSAEVRPIKGST